MLVTLFGIVRDVKRMQLLKAPFPILCNLLKGNVMLVKFMHPPKAKSPILSSKSGIAIEVKSVQFQKASSPIPVTV